MSIRGSNNRPGINIGENSNTSLAHKIEERKQQEFRLVGLNECQRLGQRMIVLDTETTGLDFRDGHKIIEIGCVELLNNKITGRFFQTYINPCREVSVGAFKVT